MLTPCWRRRRKSLLGLIGLLMLMVVRRGAIRDFLRRIAEALWEEWQRPR